MRQPICSRVPRQHMPWSCWTRCGTGHLAAPTSLGGNLWDQLGPTCCDTFLGTLSPRHPAWCMVSLAVRLATHLSDLRSVGACACSARQSGAGAHLRPTLTVL